MDIPHVWKITMLYVALIQTSRNISDVNEKMNTFHWVKRRHDESFWHLLASNTHHQEQYSSVRAVLIQGSLQRPSMARI